MFKKVLVPCVAIGVASLLGAASARAADESTKVGGKVYTDLTVISAKDANGNKTDASGYGFDIKRAYLTFDHTFDDMWSANVTTDFQYSSAVGATELYIKKAYLQAKFSDAFVLRAGSTDLPWVPFVENIYGYRFIENVMIDREHFGTSADWGLHASGKGGMFNYAVSVVDGAGYKKPVRSKGMDVEGRATVTPLDGLTVAVGMYTGTLGKETQNTSSAHTANRFDALVAYVNNGMRVGAEYFTAKDWNSVTSTTSTDKADGFSVWASYDFSPMWGVFGRADSVKLNKDAAANPKDTYFNAGVVSHPRKGVDIAVAYKHDTLKPGAPQSPKVDEFGVWGQLAF